MLFKEQNSIYAEDYIKELENLQKIAQKRLRELFILRQQWRCIEKSIKLTRKKLKKQLSKKANIHIPETLGGEFYYYPPLDELIKELVSQNWVIQAEDDGLGEPYFQLRRQ